MIGRTNACSSGGALKEVELYGGTLVAVPEILQPGDMAIIYWVGTGEIPIGQDDICWPLSFYKEVTDGNTRILAKSLVASADNGAAVCSFYDFPVVEKDGKTVLLAGVLGVERLPSEAWAKGYYTIVKAPT